jgi:hypothetical protein
MGDAHGESEEGQQGPAQNGEPPLRSKNTGSESCQKKADPEVG